MWNHKIILQGERVEINTDELQSTIEAIEHVQQIAAGVKETELLSEIKDIYMYIQYVLFFIKSKQAKLLCRVVLFVRVYTENMKRIALNVIKAPVCY